LISLDYIYFAHKNTKKHFDKSKINLYKIKTNKKIILQKRFTKLQYHYKALKEYKELIEILLNKKNIYQVDIFNSLIAQEKAILDAYLKRFTSVQEFLGAKIFPLLLEISGIPSTKMSDVLYSIEKEEIIDSLDSWIELREIQNELEHNYPDDLNKALKGLKFCIDQFETIESYYLNSLTFAQKYINEII